MNNQYINIKFYHIVDIILLLLGLAFSELYYCLMIETFYVDYQYYIVLLIIYISFYFIKNLIFVTIPNKSLILGCINIILKGKDYILQYFVFFVLILTFTQTLQIWYVQRSIKINHEKYFIINSKKTADIEHWQLIINNVGFIEVKNKDKNALPNVNEVFGSDNTAVIEGGNIINYCEITYKFLNDHKKDLELRKVNDTKFIDHLRIHNDWKYIPFNNYGIIGYTNSSINEIFDVFNKYSKERKTYNIIKHSCQEYVIDICKELADEDKGKGKAYLNQTDLKNTTALLFSLITFYYAYNIVTQLFKYIS